MLMVTLNKTHAKDARKAWIYAYESLTKNLAVGKLKFPDGEPICDFFDPWVEDAITVDGVLYLKRLQMLEGQNKDLGDDTFTPIFIDLDEDPVSEQFIKRKWFAEVWYHF